MDSYCHFCPDCKSPLEHFYCKPCQSKYACIDGIPILLPKDPKLQSVLKISEVYDSIYKNRSNVWENIGRTNKFINYFSSILGQFPNERFLEIGCGQGFLLASLSVREKYAVDLSAEALKVARTKTKARFSIALAERLPFPAKYFDLIACVGVMEHFLDIKEALQEIRRILKPGGHFVTLVHVSLTFWERLGIKISEYVYPRPKPIQFSRWLRTILSVRNAAERHKSPKQPIQNRYSTHGGEECLQMNGFRIIDVIHTRKYPELPLKGPFVVIYVAQK